jgi:protein SCO1
MKLSLIVGGLFALGGIGLLPGALAGGADYDYEPPAAGSYRLPAIMPAVDGQVLDSRGQRLRLGEQTRGKITVLSFIYTRCASAKACPYATGVLNQIHLASSKDAELRDGVRLISMSFDPEADTPERMAAYGKMAARRESGAEWLFLTARSAKELEPILDGFGQAVDRRSNPNDPLGPLNHTLRVYLIDSAGMIRNIYSSGTLDLRLVLADVKSLLGGN